MKYFTLPHIENLTNDPPLR